MHIRVFTPPGAPPSPTHTIEVDEETLALLVEAARVHEEQVGGSHPVDDLRLASFRRQVVRALPGAAAAVGKLEIDVPEECQCEFCE